MSSPVLRWMRPDLDPEDRRAALAVISAAERRRYDNTPVTRQDHFLTGRWMLRTVVSDLTGILPAAVPLCAICPDCGGEHGQPRLDAASEPCLHLSLTHGHDVVVAAAHWNSPVGIDLESGNQSAAALAAIEKLTGEQSVLRWTRVEAILKADGRGLRVDPAHVVLQEIPGSDGDSWIEGAVAGSPTRYLVSETTLQPDIRVSVAVAILPNR